MKSVNILIAEDNTIVRRDLVNSLGKIYQKVIGFTNGSEAKDYLDCNNDIDIVITDINMPLVDGFGTGADLIEYVVNKKTVKVIPIVITSAYSEMSCQYKDYNCISVLNKPFCVNNLIKEIDKLISINHIKTCTPNGLGKVKDSVNKLINIIQDC